MCFNLRRLFGRKIIAAQRYMLIAKHMAIRECRPWREFGCSDPDPVIADRSGVLESSEGEHAAIKFFLKSLGYRVAFDVVRADNFLCLKFFDEHEKRKPKLRIRIRHTEDRVPAVKTGALIIRNR